MKNLLKTISFSCCIAIIGVTVAQTNQEYNPYESIGQEAEILTLTKGKYVEFFDLDSIEIIGDAILNTNTMKVIGFIEQDTMYSEATMEPEIVSRWWAPDPVMQPHQSPYLFVANNPIIYVDETGEDNTIYLVALPGNKGALDKIDVNKVAEEANNIYKGMGLNTRVVVYESNDPFDPAHLDPTDSYAVLGSVSDVKAAFKQYGDEAADYWGGGTHPENSSNDGFGVKAKGIALDVDAMQLTADKFDATSKENAAGFLIVHGSGHNAGANHTYGARKFEGEMLTINNAAVMTEGKKIASLTTGKGQNDNFSGGLSDFTRTDFNSLFIQIIKSRFGDNQSEDNYEFNKVNKARQDAGQRPVKKNER